MVYECCIGVALAACVLSSLPVLSLDWVALCFVCLVVSSGLVLVLFLVCGRCLVLVCPWLPVFTPSTCNNGLSPAL